MIDSAVMKAANYIAMIPVCPKCDVGLFILRFKSVELDYCERCRGVWLDGGELEAIERKGLFAALADVLRFTR